MIHVAGTNGKGSTCAFVRAMAEAAGLRVHVYTSPHLVRFNERIRIAGALVNDEALAATLERIEQVNAGAPITVFEVITAAAFTLFAQHSAELCVLEVGLGGRGDATNVICHPAACAITSISLDHREMLGETVAAIAGEKAGIMKRDSPVVIGSQPSEARQVLLQHAEMVGAPVLLRGRDWDIDGMLHYSDAHGTLRLEPLSLPGPYQQDNAGIGVAALRASALAVPEIALARGAAQAIWPGRLQRLRGRLARMLPDGSELWLDGGHNPGAGEALASHLATWREPVHLIVGMKQSKDPAGFLRPLLPHAASIWAVAEPNQHLALPVEDIVQASDGKARPGPRVADALAAIGRNRQVGRVLICGSLYLAGEVPKAGRDHPRMRRLIGLLLLLGAVRPHPAGAAWDRFQILEWQPRSPAQLETLKRLGVSGGMALIDGATGTFDPSGSAARNLRAAGLNYYVENIATDFYSAYHRWQPGIPIGRRFHDLQTRYAGKSG